MRLFGLIGFLTVGLSTIYAGASWLGYEPEWWYDVTWDLKTVALVGGALVASIVGGLFGASIGISIPVPNERVNHVITVLWHYLANGSIAFFFLLALIMGRTVGEEAEIIAFVKDIGSDMFALQIVCYASAASVLAGVLVIVFGLFPYGGKTKLPWAFLVAAPPALVVSYLMFVQYRWDSPLWIVLGVLHPIATVIVSAHFVLRDALEREQVRNEMI